MKKRLYVLFILFLFSYVVPVYATNSINYSLTITDNFEFKEVINYRIEDYKQRKNGYNYMVDIINKDIYSDIFLKDKYLKYKKLENNVYYVTLAKTYNEYSLSNSAFLNNCFQKPNYKYDIDKYSFSGTEGFNCMDADTLKITIITNFPVTKTNATVEGNKYIWNPVNANFKMNIDITKQYQEAEVDPSLPYDDIHKDNNGNSNGGSSSKNKIVNKKTSKKVETIYQFVLLGGIGLLIVMAIVLKKKSSSVDKL